MFKRRHQLAWYQKLREWVWPRAGWNRMGRYFAHRLQRMPDTPYRIAAGLACGTAHGRRNLRHLTDTSTALRGIDVVSSADRVRG